MGAKLMCRHSRLSNDKCTISAPVPRSDREIAAVSIFIRRLSSYSYRTTYLTVNQEN